MTQHSAFHGDAETVAGVDISWKETYKLTDMGEIHATRGDHIVVYEDCANTLAFLETVLKN